MTITRMKTVREAREVASIHAAEIEGSFLTELGKPFLNLLYEGILHDAQSVCFLAKEEGRVVGFVCGSIEPAHLQRTLLRKHFLKVPLLIGLRLLTRPSQFRHVFATMEHLKGDVSEVKPELLSIAVTKDHSSKGIGTQLLRSLVTFFESRRIRDFKVVVDERLKANVFYRGHNFKLHARQEMLGKVMNVYVYTPR